MRNDEQHGQHPEDERRRTEEERRSGRRSRSSNATKYTYSGVWSKKSTWRPGLGIGPQGQARVDEVAADIKEDVLVEIQLRSTGDANGDEAQKDADREERSEDRAPSCR